METEPSELFVLINALEVPVGMDEEFIRGWEGARDYLEQQPGYVDTTLHQSLMPDADFRFINVGRWQTAEDFQSAIQSDGFREAAAGLASFRAHPGLYRVIRR
jgi:heme-degrading monooxygenase HmoA